jgi:hypothetical protein
MWEAAIASTTKSSTDTEVRFFTAKNYLAGDKGLVRLIRSLRSFARAFTVWIKSLRKRLLKAHFFAIPPLPAPALTF